MCYDSCNGSAQVNFPVGTYHFLWNTGDTVPGISNLCQGVYQCVVSDSAGAPIDTLQANLVQPAQLILSPGTIKNDACYGDTDGYVIFSATGGTGSRYAFNWSNGYQGFLSNNDKFHLAAGNYSVTITDLNSCSASAAFTISQPLPISFSPQITRPTGCNVCNGAVTIIPSGGNSPTYSYNWSNGATSHAVSQLCPGGYTLSVSDTSGCLVSMRINVIDTGSPVNISFSTVTNIDCTHSTGFLFATPTGGTVPYHYDWSTGSSAPDVFNLSAGIYSVSVTDSLGCFAVATDTIRNQGLIIHTLLQQNFRCDINTGKIEIAVSQGSPPYVLHWNNAANTDTLSGLRPGIYTVTVTDQANCTASASYDIAQENNTLSAQASATNVTCMNFNNGSASVNITGGLSPFAYLWNDALHQGTDTATGLPAGNYQVRITDAYGCLIYATTSVLNNYNSQVSTTTTIGNCDSTGSATASISTGIPPYNYAWNTSPAQTTATAGNLYAGNYTVSVTDSTGCVRTGTATIQYSCMGLVTGTVFYDANANCNQDNGEQGVAGVPVYVSNHNITFEGTTNLSGEYSIPVNEVGGYKILLGVGASSTVLQYGNSTCGYLEDCPANDSITFVTLRDTFQHYNFGFVGSNDFDLAINAGWAPEDANQHKEYWAMYANEAFISPYTQPATITMNYDPNLIFQSGIPTPVNNASAHTLTWTVDTIPSPTFTWARKVQAIFSVPVELPATYQLQNAFHINPVEGDCDTANNSVYTSEIAGLPSRPVSKEVSPAGDLEPGDSVLTYTIHFQNTGSDTAGVITVTDSLSPYLDPQSIVNIACSPLYNQFYIAPGVVLTWVFDPANLPASEVNGLTSAGFVSFTAKLKGGTGPGYTVKNYATVIMDNSGPLNTDTTSSFIAYPASVVDLPGNKAQVQVFPNPFSEFTNIKVEGLNDAYDFELLDMTGKVVRRVLSITTGWFEMNRETLGSGVYVYRICSKNNPVAYGKLIVEWQ